MFDWSAIIFGLQAVLGFVLFLVGGGIFTAFGHFIGHALSIDADGMALLFLLLWVVFFIAYVFYKAS